MRLARWVLAVFVLLFPVWWVLLARSEPGVVDPLGPRLSVAGLAALALGLSLLRDRFAQLIHLAITLVSIAAVVVSTWLAWANPEHPVYLWQLMAVLGAGALVLRDLSSFRLYWTAVVASSAGMMLLDGGLSDRIATVAFTSGPLFLLHGIVVAGEETLQSQIVERTTLLREIFENATDALLVVAPGDRSIVLANQRAAEMFLAADVDLLLDRDVLELPARTLDDATVAQIAEASATGEEVRMEVPFRRFHGPPFWGDAAWRGIDLGDRHYTLLRITRIDERMAAQQALEDARDAAEAATVAKSNFLASISHEIRTPLNGVLGLASLLEQTDLTPEQRSYVATLLSSGRTLMSLIDELLDFSRIEAGEMVIVDERLDLRATCDDLRLLFRAQAEAKDLQLELVVEEDVPDAVLTDGKRVRQVLVNLLGNALKFTEQGRVGLVVSRVQADGRPRLRLEVSDSGIGIDAIDLPRLFEPFSQGDPGIARRYGGTGLGLAISKTIADRLGGRLVARSERNVGSTFTFEIPLRVVGSDDAHGGAAATDAVPIDRLRPVLVAEDNEVNRKVVVAMLRRLGCDVDTVGDGAEAVERAGQRTYDVVFMDMMMPGVDGLEATRRLRRLQVARRPYVVALTASVSPQDRQACLAAGMDDFVAKPIQ
ncbi:MAG: response regulator, partial [Alphaproteobacteria bacterium]|nr:response regulator [Alphaproteobacteria bacterium]